MTHIEFRANKNLILFVIHPALLTSSSDLHGMKYSSNTVITNNTRAIGSAKKA